MPGPARRRRTRRFEHEILVQRCAASRDDLNARNVFGSAWNNPPATAYLRDRADGAGVIDAAVRRELQAAIRPSNEISIARKFTRERGIDGLSIECVCLRHGCNAGHLTEGGLPERQKSQPRRQKGNCPHLLYLLVHAFRTNRDQLSGLVARLARTRPIFDGAVNVRFVRSPAYSSVPSRLVDVQPQAADWQDRRFAAWRIGLRGSNTIPIEQPRLDAGTIADPGPQPKQVRVANTVPSAELSRQRSLP